MQSLHVLSIFFVVLHLKERIRLMEKNFDTYWEMNSRRLVENAPEALRRERENSKKMNTAGDWILAIIPIAAALFFIQQSYFHSEMVNLVIGLLIGAVSFVVCEMAKPYVTGKRSLSDIDEDIKEHYRKEYESRKE